MAENEAIVVILEALLEQTRAIRDVKVQAESLKNMMLEHRPAFIPTFEEQVRKVNSSPALQNLDTMIARLEEALRGLQP